MENLPSAPQESKYMSSRTSNHQLAMTRFRSPDLRCSATLKKGPQVAQKAWDRRICRDATADPWQQIFHFKGAWTTSNRQLMLSLTLTSTVPPPRVLDCLTESYAQQTARWKAESKSRQRTGVHKKEERQLSSSFAVRKISRSGLEVECL